MNLKMLLKLVAITCLFVISGCGGSGSDGLNGSIELATTVDGIYVTATATYTSPTKDNLIGVPISFSYDGIDLGTYNTNNSGSVGLTFMLSPFDGQKDIVVQATSGNLSDFDVVSVTGAILKLTPPAAATQTFNDTDIPGTIAPFTLSIANFVSISDPFTGQVAGHPISVTATFVATPSASISDSLSPAQQTITTSATGIAALPGVLVNVAVPDTVSSRVITVTWTVTDMVTGFTDSGSTALTVTRTAVYAPPLIIP